MVCLSNKSDYSVFVDFTEKAAILFLLGSCYWRHLAACHGLQADGTLEYSGHRPARPALPTTRDRLSHYLQEAT